MGLRNSVLGVIPESFLAEAVIEFHREELLKSTSFFLIANLDLETNPPSSVLQCNGCQLSPCTGASAAFLLLWVKESNPSLRAFQLLLKMWGFLAADVCLASCF